MGKATILFTTLALEFIYVFCRSPTSKFANGALARYDLIHANNSSRIISKMINSFWLSTNNADDVKHPTTFSTVYFCFLAVRPEYAVACSGQAVSIIYGVDLCRSIFRRLSTLLNSFIAHARNILLRKLCIFAAARVSKTKELQQSTIQKKNAPIICTNNWNFQSGNATSESMVFAFSRKLTKMAKKHAK